MSKTIILPTAKKPEGELFALDQINMGYERSKDNTCTVKRKFFDWYRHISQESLVTIPYEITKALIDAAQNPVCPACGGKLYEMDEDAIIDNRHLTWVECYECSWNNPVIEHDHLPIWLPRRLAAIAMLRYPAVMWQWLQSLKEKTDE